MRVLLLFLTSITFLTGVSRAGVDSWVGIWATAPQQEAPAPELLAGQRMVLRQIVRISAKAETVRLHLSNEYGTDPLVLEDVHVAMADAGGAIRVQTDRPVLFGGATRVSIPPKSTCVSDPLAFSVPALSDLAVTFRLVSLPGKLAGHPGSRANSYMKAGADTADVALAGAMKIVYWYILTGIDTSASGTAKAAVVCLGDSITDGRGVLPDQNTRWTDALARRLQSDPATSWISVLNLGIGGGRLLRPGSGPSGLDRLSRDVFGQAGVRWLILQLGVNDLGTRIKAKAAGLPYASAQDIIAGYQQVIAACREHGVRVGLATITPDSNAGWYSTPDIEADRQVINKWIRESAPCDRVIDFDAALRDPAQPSVLLAAYDCGDHLHPSMAGYRLMAQAVPLDFLVPAGSGEK
jgi:lysophospholipase L1-like esterase